MFMRRIGRLSVVLLLLVVPACVELTGQRIAWFHDEEKDELRILLAYDGIHDSGSDRHGKGVEQISKFLRGGDVMLLDWILHLDMEHVRKEAADPATKPLEREWAQLLVSIRTEPVGHYRELDGRIGVAQRITIPQLRQFLAKLNATISKAIGEIPKNQDPAFHRTMARIRQAAERGNTWVRLDGQAIRIRVPVDPSEWTVLKAAALRQVAQSAASALNAKAGSEERESFDWGLRALTSAPLSYVEGEDHVEFTVGRPKTASTLRLQIRGKYEPSLEKTVIQTVPANLDKSLADAMLQRSAAASPAVRDVLAWGPSEERVRALLAEATAADPKRREAAIKQLEALGSLWESNGVAPKAPEKTPDAAQYLAAWKNWYAQVQMREPPFTEALKEAKPSAKKP